VRDIHETFCIYVCSNSGGSAIANFTLHHWQSGLQRNEIKLKDVETLLMKTVFNENGTCGCLLNYSLVIEVLLCFYRAILRRAPLCHSMPTVCLSLTFIHVFHTGWVGVLRK